jgi:hypothetical protein
VAEVAIEEEVEDEIEEEVAIAPPPPPPPVAQGLMPRPKSPPPAGQSGHKPAMTLAQRVAAASGPRVKAGSQRFMGLAE